VLRRVFGPKRDEVTGEWRKLHNEELNNLYSLPNIVRVVKLRRMRWAGHVARMGEDRGVHRVLVGKPEGKRPLERPRRRSKHVEQLRNTGIINSTTRSHLVGYFYTIYIIMHGSMNIKLYSFLK
jgi:hypothetical protein